MARVDELLSWHVHQKLLRAKDALEKNGFRVILAENRQEALEKVLALIPPDARVGVGGSLTIREVGIIEALTQRGNEVVHHWVSGISAQERYALMREELNTDVFLCSSNAITEDGKLVNVDDCGNRVAAMIFGPRKVIVVAGENKIVRNVEEAVQRIRGVAAPLNARRLGVEVPCAKTGACVDCKAPKRVCRVTTIIERDLHQPDPPHITVVLVAERLGF